MGHERGGRDYRDDRHRPHAERGRDDYRDREYRERDYGRDDGSGYARSSGHEEDRGFIGRAGDDVRSWFILLTRGDKDADGGHHSIPWSWIVEVGDTAKVNRTAAQAQAAWKDEGRDQGPHILNRAFAGTY